MSRSLPLRLRRTLLLTALSAGSACVAPSQPTAVRFSPGQLTAQQGVVALELTAAEYREQGVAVDVTVRNDSDHAIAIDREGILLRYKELEFPVDTQDTAAPAASIDVPGGGAVQLRLAFVTGSILRDDATLRLRAIRSGERWLAGGRIPVPPVPPAAREDNRRRRTASSNRSASP